MRYGVFCQEFRFGCEDIELGYRLAKRGLKVRFHRRAIQYMNRPITFDEFCRRCEKQGRSQAHFHRIHNSDPVVRRYCGIDNASDVRRNGGCLFEDESERVRAIERLLIQSSGNAIGANSLRHDLHHLYGSVFRAFFIKGVVEMSNLRTSAETPTR